jgi:hypothetical protein
MSEIESFGRMPSSARWNGGAATLTSARVRPVLTRVLAVFFLAATFALSGCYHYRVVTPDAPATEYNRTTLHAMFWGLLQHDADVGDCVSNALVEVRVRNNAGYILLSAVTLGIWVPLDVEWRCAKIPAVEGEL